MTPEELSDRLWQFAARVGCEQLIKLVAKSVITAKRKGSQQPENLK